MSFRMPLSSALRCLTCLRSPRVLRDGGVWGLVTGIGMGGIGLGPMVVRLNDLKKGTRLNF